MLATSAAALSALVALGSWFGVDGSGKIKEETRTLPAFHGIEVGGGATVHVRLGKTQRVTLRTDDNLLPLIRTEVKDGILHVEQKKSLSPTDDLTLDIVVASLDRISVSGGVELYAEVGPTKTFDLDGSGGTEIKIKGLDTPKLAVNLSGGVDAHLSGKAEQASVDLSGGVDLEAAGLSLKRATVDASGGVEAHLAVSEHLTGDASGGVTVKVKGRPKMNVDTSGAGSFDLTD